MLSGLVGIFLTLLPEGMRRSVNWQGSLRRAAVASGVIELLGAVSVLIFRYQQYAAHQLAQVDQKVFIAAAEKGGESAVQSFGMMILIAYVFTPLSLVLVYLGLEGAFRFATALGTGEVVGTLPLVLVEKAMGLTGRYGREVSQGPRIPDLVFEPDTDDGERYDLGVASCRLKNDWNHLVTISYQGVLYEVAGYMKAAPPRRHLYLLRRAPAHKIVRNLYQYDPNEGSGLPVS